MGYAHHSDGEFKKLAVSRRNEMLESVHRVHGKALRDNGSNGHLFGNKTTYADLALYAFVQHFRAESAKDESAVLTAHFDLEVVPEFEKLVSAVEADPALKEYFGRKESPALA
ncbi:hypothetical protein FBU59_007283 [Linderina macrospora]|uniref:Uncharacterized protein n=1 Tax=Linderina macrospora TaxID=4868 RepID=A0ACC1IXK0_9FUNG|nr:hypothetical protein FBU59_007283 [Linderina macrospora]